MQGPHLSHSLNDAREEVIAGGLLVAGVEAVGVPKHSHMATLAAHRHHTQKPMCARRGLACTNEAQQNNQPLSHINDIITPVSSHPASRQHTTFKHAHRPRHSTEQALSSGVVCLVT